MERGDVGALAAADGRVRRRERSHEAIVTALFELVGEGVIEPTAQQVAERAGVVTRTVFRHFSEMESLFAEIEARLHREVLPLLAGGERGGRLAARAGAFVRQRAAFFERILPYKRSGNARRQRSPFLRSRHALLVRALRTDLLRWLPELANAPADLVEAFDLATSFESWDRLRAEQRLSSRRALAVMECTVVALVRELRSPRAVRGPGKASSDQDH